MLEASRNPARERDAAGFDVVVPCYNYGNFLATAVTSVLDQGVSLRVLVIDDASTDCSECVGRSLADADSRVTYRRHPSNQGHIQTYNEGIDWAEAAFFVILSADDLLIPGALQRSAAALSAHPEMAMTYGRALHFDDGLPEAAVRGGDVPAEPYSHGSANARLGARGQAARRLEAADTARIEVLGTDVFFARNRQFNIVPACSVVTRTRWQKRLGGYLPHLPHAGDLEMWLRFAAHGPVGCIPQFQVAVRRHASNMSRQYDSVKDTLQRAETLWAIERGCSRILPAGTLAAMRANVADIAIRACWQASANGDARAASEMLALALTIDPSVKRRPIWMLHAASRAIGARRWESLRRVRSNLRRAWQP